MSDKHKDRLQLAHREFLADQEKRRLLVNKLLAESDFLDDEGYPTQNSLEIIINWNYDCSVY